MFQKCRKDEWSQEETGDFGDSLTWNVWGEVMMPLKTSSNWERGGERKQRKEKHIIWVYFYWDRNHFTSQQAHTHWHYPSCQRLRSVCMLGHVDWVLQVLFTHACMVRRYSRKKKHWWAGFKEPCLLFQHQKVHLGASIIFMPYLGSGWVILWGAIVSLTLSHLLSGCQS